MAPRCTSITAGTAVPRLQRSPSSVFAITCCCPVRQRVPRLMATLPPDWMRPFSKTSWRRCPMPGWRAARDGIPRNAGATTSAISWRGSNSARALSRRPSVRAPEPYDYAVVRVVPRVERDEFINAGILLSCQRARFLQARIALDEARLLALDPHVDLE